MAFESLTDKLQNVFKKLKRQRTTDRGRCKGCPEGSQDGSPGSRC